MAPSECHESAFTPHRRRISYRPRACLDTTPSSLHAPLAHQFMPRYPLTGFVAGRRHARYRRYQVPQGGGGTGGDGGGKPTSSSDRSRRSHSSPPPGLRPPSPSRRPPRPSASPGARPERSAGLARAVRFQGGTARGLWRLARWRRSRGPTAQRQARSTEPGLTRREEGAWASPPDLFPLLTSVPRRRRPGCIDEAGHGSAPLLPAGGR